MFFGNYGPILSLQTSPGDECLLNEMHEMLNIHSAAGTPPTLTYQRVKNQGFVETIIVLLMIGLYLYHYTINHTERKDVCVRQCSMVTKLKPDGVF